MTAHTRSSWRNDLRTRSGQGAAVALLLTFGAGCGTTTPDVADPPNVPGGPDLVDVPTVDPTSVEERWSKQLIVARVGLVADGSGGGWTLPHDEGDCVVEHVFNQAMLGTLYANQGERVVFSPDRSAGVVVPRESSGLCLDALEEALAVLR